jgi:hypothetical protein
MDSNLSLNMCLQGKAGSVGKALAVGTGEWMNGLAIHLCSVDFLIEPFSPQCVLKKLPELICSEVLQTWRILLEEKIVWLVIFVSLLFSRLWTFADLLTRIRSQNGFS